MKQLLFSGYKKLKGGSQISGYFFVYKKKEQSLTKVPMYLIQVCCVPVSGF